MNIKEGDIIFINIIGNIIEDTTDKITIVSVVSYIKNTLTYRSLKTTLVNRGDKIVLSKIEIDYNKPVKSIEI